MGWDEKHNWLPTFLSLSRHPLWIAFIVFLLSTSLLFRLCLLLPTNTTSALLDFTLSVKLGLNHTVATPWEHASVHAHVHPPCFYIQVHYRGWKLFLLAAVHRRGSPKHLQYKRKASKSMGEKSYYYLLCNQREIEPRRDSPKHKGTANAGRWAHTLEDTAQWLHNAIILPLLNPQLFKWFWGHSWSAYTFAWLPREDNYFKRSWWFTFVGHFFLRANLQ